MTARPRYRVAVGDREVELPVGWELTWLDRRAGIARLARGHAWRMVVVEGSGSDWQVTVDGRRVAVHVRTHREQLLAEAEVAARHHGGPVDVRASLPGLVVALAVTVGEEVEEGHSLLTIEAMKMQNEVRAPHAGRVAHVAVSAGETVATGALLMRLE
jgi:pyruvate carboxylase subunit B